MMTLTEKWKMEGIIGAKKEDILKLINLKFGRVSDEVEKSISEISDLKELDNFLQRLFWLIA